MTVREKNKTRKGMFNHYMWKNIRKQYKNNKLEKLQLGMTSLHYQIVHILFQIFQIMLSLLEET